MRSDWTSVQSLFFLTQIEANILTYQKWFGSYLPTLHLKSSIMASMYIRSKSTSSMSLLAQLAKRSGSSLDAVMICLVFSMNSVFVAALFLDEEMATLGGLG